MKFVIGRTLTILSWDNPVTAFFRKSKNLRHSLGRPSRSDFVHFQFSGLLCSEINVYISFTLPKSAPWQAPFYAGLRVVDLRSSPSTGSILKVGETLILQRFSYFVAEFVCICVYDTSVHNTYLENFYICNIWNF